MTMPNGIRNRCGSNAMQKCRTNKSCFAWGFGALLFLTWISYRGTTSSLPVESPHQNKDLPNPPQGVTPTTNPTDNAISSVVKERASRQVPNAPIILPSKSDNDAVASTVSNEELRTVLHKFPQLRGVSQELVNPGVSSSPDNIPQQNPQTPPTIQDHYVVFSTTLSSFARPQDYDYLAPLVARNWHVVGNFTPIVVVVATQASHIDAVQTVWKSSGLLPSHTILLPLVTTPEWAITVAQMSRLYAAAFLTPNEVPDHAYLRVTDADMMIARAKPFVAPANPSVDISIYNGKCCLGANPVHFNPNGNNNNTTTPTNVTKSCNQYPMHSVGMKVAHWRTLFPVPHANNNNTTAPQNLTQHIVQLAHDYFGYGTHVNDVQAPTVLKHGAGSQWYMDQVLLGCTIDQANAEGYHLELPPAGSRIHVWNAVPGTETKKKVPTAASHSIWNRDQKLSVQLASPTMKAPPLDDIHLATFRLSQHGAWMNRLVQHTTVLQGYQTAYQDYTRLWKSTYQKPLQ